IPLLRRLRMLSEGTDKPDVIDNFTAEDLRGVVASPVFHIIRQYLSNQCHYKVWCANNRGCNKVVMPVDVYSLQPHTIMQHYVSVPAWARHDLLASVTMSCINVSLHNCRSLS